MRSAADMPEHHSRTAIRLHLVILLLAGAIAGTAWEERSRRRAATRLDRLRRLQAGLSTGHAPSAAPPVPAAASGWIGLAKRLYGQITEDRVLAIAAGVTFYALLALVPTLAALVSLYGLVADPATISDHLSRLYFLLPDAAVDVIGNQVSRIAARAPESLGLTLGLSLALSLWSANAGMKAIFEALNIVHGVRDRRSFFGLTLQTLGFTLGAILFLLLSLSGIVVIPAVLNWLGLGRAFELLLLLRWPAMAGVLALGLAILYRWGPCRPKPVSGRRWAGIAIGCITAACAWVGASMLFSWYVSNFADYNQTYGSLGAAIGFMTWIWISAIIVLLGGEIDAEIEREAPWQRGSGT